MLSYRRQAACSPGVAWALIARPERWSEWAPHIRGARGLGTPEVEMGRRGTVRLLGALPVPARIVAKEPGRMWAWTVGPARIEHAVEPAPAGCAVRVSIAAPRALEAALAVTYGPLVALLVRNLARVSTAHARG